ncbi:hypothetical protein ACFQL1_15605 [Halomicroarcula sp. GCM10025709]|uniref:hypothetical protein n=1 Tax=Halomicroarcula sp. GCM10025709 TaxID=3252669 RepID=UPI00360FFBD5
MRHVRVRITAAGDEAAVHPMYDLLTNAPFVERATALQWNFTGEAFGILHYVVGDHDAFVSRVDEVPQVVDFETVRADEDAFYAYVQDATTESLRDLFGPVTASPLVAVPLSSTTPTGRWRSRCSAPTRRSRPPSTPSRTRST